MVHTLMKSDYSCDVVLPSHARRSILSPQNCHIRNLRSFTRANLALLIKSFQLPAGKMPFNLNLYQVFVMRIGSSRRHEKIPASVFVLLLRCCCWILFFSFPGIVSSSVVTLQSIQIFKSHAWLTSEPTIYFRCQGENKTILPDVKKTYFLYTFKGAESWQPLTELVDQKCNRCGLYEKDRIKSDDVFDEWELCPDDFLAPDGRYLRVKEKEFNLTLSCRQCLPLEPNSVRTPSSPSESNDKGMYVLLVILISAVVSVGSVIGLIYGYKYWQKRKREKEQAQFLKLFEDGDDIEDELGLEHDMI